MAIIKKFRIKSFKNTTPLLSLEKISLNFGNRKILDNVNFTINSGEIVGMLGPNGVGKSTIFNLITGLIKPDHGKIKFGKEDATETSVSERMKKYSVGYVPQYGGYFHDLTLIENLKAIGQIQIKDPNERHHKINNLIGKFEFEPVMDVKAGILSGGQKKKLVIALALLGDPKVLLLDECFAALDILTIRMLQNIIVNLQSENNIGICICNHQARDLLSCVDIAMVLSNCKIIAKGTPQQLINDIDAQNAYFGQSFKFKI